MKIKDLIENYSELELSDDILKQLGIEVKVDKFEKPKTGEWYFYISSANEVYRRVNVEGDIDETFLSVGNYYPENYFTKEEVKKIARQKLEYDKAVWELKREIARLNDGWFPNWGNENEKKVSVYSDEGNITHDFWYTHKYMPNWLYLKSYDLCEQLIKTHSKQLKIYLEIE